MCHPRYLRGWEIIIVTVCHDSNPICKTNSGKAASSPNKHSFLWLETRVASLGLGKSPLRPGSKVVGALVDTKKNPRPFNLFLSNLASLWRLRFPLEGLKGLFKHWCCLQSAQAKKQILKIVTTWVKWWKISMFDCSTVTICCINACNALCFSCDKNCSND